MKKALLLIIGTVLAGSVLLSATSNWVLKIGMEQAVTRMTGFKTKVRAFRYNFPSTIRIQDLEIWNPSGFEEKVFAKIPEVYISFFAMEFFRGQGVRFGEIRLYVQEVHIEKNLKGVSNVELMNLAGYGPNQFMLFAKRTPFLVERLELTLRNVSYEDRSGMTATSGASNKYSMDLNVQNRVYTKIHDPQTLVNLVLVEIIHRATFGKLLGLDPEKLLGGAYNAGEAFVGEQANALARQAGHWAGQASDFVNRAEIPEKAGFAYQDSVRGTQGVLRDTTAAAGKMASKYWGKLKSFMPKEKNATKS